MMQKVLLKQGSKRILQRSSVCRSCWDDKTDAITIAVSRKGCPVPQHPSLFRARPLVVGQQAVFSWSCSPKVTTVLAPSPASLVQLREHL